MQQLSVLGLALGGILGVVCGSVHAQEAATSNAMLSETMPINFFDQDGPDSLGESPAGTEMRYLRISGSSFAPRYNAGTQYLGSGCIRADQFETTVAADVQLPKGAVIRYVRTYFFNSNNAGTISAYLTGYDNQGGFTEYTNYSTPLNAFGYLTQLSPQITVPVNPFDESFVVVVNIGTGSQNLRFCGVRIQYDY